MPKFEIEFEPTDILDYDEGFTTYEIEAKDLEDASKQAEKMLNDPDVLLESLKSIQTVDIKIKSIKKLKEVV